MYFDALLKPETTVVTYTYKRFYREKILAYLKILSTTETGMTLKIDPNKEYT